MNDSVYDALFRQAVIDNFLEELDSLPPDEELAMLHTFSPEHESRMRRLFARETRKARVHAAVKWSLRAAAALVISAAVIFEALVFVPQARAAVAQTIIEWYSQFTRFTTGEPDTEITAPEPRYVPEGYAEIVHDNWEMMSTIIYENEDGGVIIFDSVQASGSLSVGNENKSYEARVIGGVEYHVFESTVTGGDSSVVWEFMGQRFAIISGLPIGELMAMAESVE
jgi:hypothetical protein